ncbi:MAG TPA: hypothetical protein VG798_05745 [Rhizomicrobium sp.]|nr:hypothetical protein [Rhizomicrobium sp.]
MPEYKVPFQLFTKNATRGAEVRVRPDGTAYYIALEHIEGAIWKPLGNEIGPYGSPEEAEVAAINSSWFVEGYRR